MARPRCFECGRQLVYAKGGGVVSKTWTDPIGNAHQMHKDCFARGGYANPPITAQPAQK